MRHEVLVKWCRPHRSLTWTSVCFGIDGWIEITAGFGIPVAMDTDFSYSWTTVENICCAQPSPSWNMVKSTALLVPAGFSWLWLFVGTSCRDNITWSGDIMSDGMFLMLLVDYATSRCVLFMKRTDGVWKV